MADDREVREHKEWLGYVQPVGLLVSPVALAEAQAVVSRNVVEKQQRLMALVERRILPGGREGYVLTDFAAFTRELLGYEAGDLVEGAELPDTLSVTLREEHEVLRPTWAVHDSVNAAEQWLALIVEVETGRDLDKVGGGEDVGQGWHASPQARLERLLHATGIPVGLLFNGTHLRLVYAPSKESSGHATFAFADLIEVPGRLLLGALDMLLSAFRVLQAHEKARLGALLKRSRDFQAEVSTRLAEQVLRALDELLKGFQAADDVSDVELLSWAERNDPQHVYGGLVTGLMRLVFLLYAEDRGLMPQGEVYTRNYAVAGLFERLRDDFSRYPDTINQRYGAWARLLTLFRLVHDGGGHGDLRLPPRHGQLFDPDAFPFLEGRPYGSARQMGQPIEAPRVADGVIYRVLSNLLMLDGERLSYRTLDVEQIGSVYEAIMGFELQRAAGPSVAVRPSHAYVNVETLLAQKPGDRAKWLKEEAACDLATGPAGLLKNAQTVEDVVAALGRKLSPRTPSALPTGSLFLQPGEERRRTGSHYTPRSLTRPIVETTLRPVLEALGPEPTPEQILGLKVCDPAMGSGAFLVEACRQLGDALLAAWIAHGHMPKVPPDEEPALHAMRLVAQRCLYGVDKNPFAANLARLSLWLVTLAKDHPFTFLDHALRHGDSLVGLTRRQIRGLDWQTSPDPGPLANAIDQAVKAAGVERQAIHAAGDDAGQEWDKRRHWKAAEEALADTRRLGDLVVAAFFAAQNDKGRKEKRLDLLAQVNQRKSGHDVQAVEEAWNQTVAALRFGERPVPPFHWEIEFPEVFDRDNAGFDSIVGNPPFQQKNAITNMNRPRYHDFLQSYYYGTNGKSDLIAFFFRRGFNLVRERGTTGLVATNTIAQGFTREAGLTPICVSGGYIYSAERRLSWPGIAAVVVSVVHTLKNRAVRPVMLDNREVVKISAFLFHGGEHTAPSSLKANERISFHGADISGVGFTFDDDTPEANPTALMRSLIADNRVYSEKINEYIGGADFNQSPDLSSRRWVFGFGRLPETECSERWPALVEIARSKVLPDRASRPNNDQSSSLCARWWQWHTDRPTMLDASRGLDRVLVNCQVGPHVAFGFQPTSRVFAHTLNVFTKEECSFFAALQSRCHEIWARLLGSSMKDDLRYTLSDCFETFPFPTNWETDPVLEAAGQAYYDFRAALMVANNEGLTKTYNRFHDPEHDGSGVEGRSPANVRADIVRLRELHAAMDRAVLDAYGWHDISTDCEFLLDYEEPDDPDDDGRARKRKKPWRYRWPDVVRDEVLARLLELNRVRAEEERLAGPGLGKGPVSAEDVKAKRGRKPGKAKAADPGQVSMFAPESVRDGTTSTGSLGPLFERAEE